MPKTKKHARYCPTCKRTSRELTEPQAKDFDFYGECDVCRGVPLTRNTHGGSPAESHDREYHGGQFNAGEW